ncbi:MAG TPA: transposase [Chloroflexota bacterium]|nr:transposase [Chloroflexota bacterium]
MPPKPGRQRIIKSAPDPSFKCRTHCRGSGLPIAFRLAPANRHDAPFAQPLLALAVHLYGLRLRVVRLDAAYWGPALIAWIHTTLHATAVIPWNPKRTKNRACLPPCAGR